MGPVRIRRLELGELCSDLFKFRRMSVWQRGLRSTALTAVKTTAVAPTLNAIDTKAIPVTAGVRHNIRKAW
jgi:hypothetical protein